MKIRAQKWPKVKILDRNSPHRIPKKSKLKMRKRRRRDCLKSLNNNMLAKLIMRKWWNKLPRYSKRMTYLNLITPSKKR